MKHYTVRKYTSQDFDSWNAFIANAKNATFLFHRNFMEYHADRFEDFSLMVFDDAKLVAALPANRVADEVFSHQGLTYGGLVLNEKVKLREVIDIFTSILKHLKRELIEKLHIKLLPSIYFKSLSEEINYALFIADAKLMRRDSLSVLDLSQTYKITKSRKQGIRRGKKNNLKIVEELNFELFWDKILIPNMQSKHAVKPVHSIIEIKKLQSLFPQNIRHFNVYYNEKIVAGTTVFVTDKVAHPQYISGNDEKNEIGSLDFLYHYLIIDVFKDKRYFDFGISNEENGRKLNEGLIFWKESFGARTLTQDFYEVETKNFFKLENVLI